MRKNRSYLRMSSQRRLSLVEVKTQLHCNVHCLHPPVTPKFKMCHQSSTVNTTSFLALQHKTLLSGLLFSCVTKDNDRCYFCYGVICNYIYSVVPPTTLGMHTSGVGVCKHQTMSRRITYFPLTSITHGI